jgi:hypothetical protein
MLKNSKFSIWLALMLAVILMAGLNPSGALAQCGGGDHSGMHQQHMGSGGQMGMYGTQAPVQPDPNAVAPNPVNPVPPQVSGYTMPQQDTGGYGQMKGRGGASSGHSGHMGTN